MCSLGINFAHKFDNCAMVAKASFNTMVEETIRTNWEKYALTDYKGATLQFHDVARKIEKLHILFENSGLRLLGEDGDDDLGCRCRGETKHSQSGNSFIFHGVVHSR